MTQEKRLGGFVDYQRLERLVSQEKAGICFGVHCKQLSRRG
jgi:hypothetical protein